MGSWHEQLVDQQAGERWSILSLGRERVLTHQCVGVRGSEHSGVRGRGAMVQCWTERAVPTGRIDRDSACVRNVRFGGEGPKTLPRHS